MSAQLLKGDTINLNTGKVERAPRPIVTIAGKSYKHPNR